MKKLHFLGVVLGVTAAACSGSEGAGGAGEGGAGGQGSHSTANGGHTSDGGGGSSASGHGGMSSDGGGGAAGVGGGSGGAGEGGNEVCGACEFLFQDMVFPPDLTEEDLCAFGGEAYTAYVALEECGCGKGAGANGENCKSDCGDSFCAGDPVSGDCYTCLSTTCSEPFNLCAAY